MKKIAENNHMTVFSDLEMSADIQTTQKSAELQISTIHVHPKALASSQTAGSVKLEFSFPATNISGRWYPVCKFDRAVKADYDSSIESMTASSAPVVCFYSADGKNRHAIALSEVRQKVFLKCGIHEEDGSMLCVIEIPVTQGFSDTHFQFSIWESLEAKNYWEVLDEVRSWWEDTLQIVPATVPEAAKKPMYSFWYSMHQNVTAKNVEEESRRAAQMGFSAVIVDDGWQTEDNNRGYAYCGDWEPSRQKFPDFAGHVANVQAMGLKYLLWFSVPYIGKKAKAWNRFQDKLLRFNESQQAGILDLRYPEVREYLKNIYVKAVRDWNLDGLKLDFIDEFYFQEDSPAYNESMDCQDIQDALNLFLTDVMDTLKQIRPDILIEFRQKYIGPQIRRYGNIFRVNDCPGSAVSNRIGTIDLRLLSGNTAVHSDMLMWHASESPEDAALQLLSCLFSTVQISVCLDQISEEMRQMLLFWLSFMEKNRALLLSSQIQPSEPENLYPEVCAEHGNEKVLVHYSMGRVADLTGAPETLYYIHAAKAEEVCFRCNASNVLAYEVKNCFGQTVAHGEITGNPLFLLSVPTSGMVVFMKKRAAHFSNSGKSLGEI